MNEIVVTSLAADVAAAGRGRTKIIPVERARKITLRRVWILLRSNGGFSCCTQAIRLDGGGPW